MIENQYPHHGTYGEENDAERSDAEWLWVIDPIDGTKSFATGKPPFGCLIALLHHRKPILGIIDMPALQERWIGIAGEPTRFNGQPCRTSSANILADVTLNATTPDMFNTKEWALFSELGALRCAFASLGLTVTRTACLLRDLPSWSWKRVGASMIT